MKRRLTLVILMMAEFLALSLNEQLLTMAQTLPQASPDNPAPSSLPSFLTINVNSNRDDNLRDRELTLHEAILIANGTLRTDQLTPAVATRFDFKILRFLRFS
jgi:hypothetical protein